MSDETVAERYQREITEIAEVLLRKYYPRGTTMSEVWAGALRIHNMQFIVDRLETLAQRPDEKGGNPQ